MVSGFGVLFGWGDWFCDLECLWEVVVSEIFVGVIGLVGVGCCWVGLGVVRLEWGWDLGFFLVV